MTGMGRPRRAREIGGEMSTPYPWTDRNNAWTASDGRTVCMVVPDLTRKHRYLWTVRDAVRLLKLNEGSADDFEAAKKSARRAARHQILMVSI